MAKKIEINENWEPVEVEDLDNLFIVVFKHGSFDQGYVEAFDTDDVLMQSAYDSLAKQYDDCGCDELTKIYLIKVPNTDQTVNMCNTGLFNGNCCDPHVIEATRDLFNRADCEQLSCWEGCGLTEAKKKKKPYSSAYCGFTDPELNIKHFNKCMGTGGLQNPDAPHLVVGDTLPNAPVASDSAGGEAASGGEGGAIGESLTEAKEESLEDKIRSVIAHKETDDWHDGKAYLFEVSDESKNSDNGDIDPFWVEKFDDDEVDFSKLKVYDRTPEEKENGKYIATFMISGGKNGSGDWTEYLGQLTDAFKALKEKTGAEPLLYKLDTDICDDVWTGYVFLYDHDDTVKESLTEDLIVIEPNEAKEKLTELQDQIKAEKDEKVRRSLLTLMNIYLFQTYKPSDREGSTITDDEWQEISDWQQDALKKEKWVQQEDGLLKTVDEEDNLTEAVNYGDQIEKMRALENGTRGFNAKAASSEKLRVNRQVCIDYKFYKALKVVEDEMISRGMISQRYSPKVNVKISDCKLEPKDFILGSAKVIWAERDNPQQLIKDYGNSIFDLLIILVFALWMKEAALADAIKDHITTKFTVTVNELKDYLNKLFTDRNLIIAVKQIIQECCAESLVEDTGYSHKLMDKFEVPPQIKLLDQKQVEDFIKQLSPEELFRVGYATPLYFYSELDDKFDLVKATEMEGYTGLDYRDAVADQSVADHAERVANAQRQIDTYADVLDKNQGHKLNKSGERFSTTYRATNKLALNPEKSNEYVEYELDDNGEPKLDAKGEKIIKSKIDMNKILFYPRVGSQPITHYYIDFHNGQGFKPIRREVLVDTLYKFIMEVEKANAQGVSKTDLMWLQKKGYGNVRKDANGAIQAFYDAHGKDIPIWAHRKAEEAGVTPEEYYKEHPYSSRWSMADFRKKASTWVDADASIIMAQDADTVSGKDLAAVQGMDRTVSHAELKPQVRALYSNQVYFLDGKPGKFGNMLHEGLEEEVELDEAKRYVKRYYVRPLNIFCGNKEDIIQALIRAGDQNCSVYSLKNLTNHEDVHLLQPSDIIYYWDDRVLYDKNHVQVMDYDLFVKHEEERKKVGNVDAISDSTFSDIYDDRATEDDLKDKDVIANYKALNKITR